MRAGVLVLATLVAVLLGSTVPTPAAPPGGTRITPDADPARAGSLDLSIRARSLGLVPPSTDDPAALGVETMRAPTGAGSTRWPSPVTEIAPNVHLYMAPACLPGEDPLSPRRPVLRRH